MLLYATNGITTEPMKPLLMKQNVSFYIKKHRETFMQHRENLRKTQAILSWLECAPFVIAGIAQKMTDS